MIRAALHLTAAALLVMVLGATTPLIFGLAMLLALLPDLDTPRSLIGDLLRPVSERIEAAVGHRTATHSLLALALVAGLTYLLLPAWWPVLAGAYASHLVLDLLIGNHGVMLFWPGGEFLTLAGWRDDGPAPRRLLFVLLPATLLAASWPQLQPVLAPTFSAAAAVANPIATPTPPRTPVPAIRLSLALPAGVPLSALRVRTGEVLAEGQLLAAWEPLAATPWPSPTPPPIPPSPAAIPVAITDSAAARGVAEAEAALESLTIVQAAERAALLAEQQRALADIQRRLDKARRALDALQPQHERGQAEAQLAVEQAHQHLVDAQAAASLVAPADPAARERTAEHVHAAEAALRSALAAQDRMRTDQGLERQQAEAAVEAAQADLTDLPAQQRAALAKLDGQHASARILALARVQSARSNAEDSQRQRDHDQLLAATTATAAATTWQADVTATAQAHAALVQATAHAQPTPAPNQILSRAAGRIVAISAEEHDGQLVVTLELVP